MRHLYKAIIFLAFTVGLVAVVNAATSARVEVPADILIDSNLEQGLFAEPANISFNPIRPGETSNTVALQVHNIGSECYSGLNLQAVMIDENLALGTTPTTQFCPGESQWVWVNIVSQPQVVDQHDQFTIQIDGVHQQ